MKIKSITESLKKQYPIRSLLPNWLNNQGNK